MDQQLSFSSLEKQAEWLTQLVITYGLKLLGAIAIVYFGFWFVKKASNLVDKRFESKSYDLDPSVVNFVHDLVKISLQLLVIFVAISTAGIEMASIFAVLTGATIGIGLALQGSISNFASGVMMIWIRPFSVGDLIESKDHVGYVEKIEILNTSIRTPQNKVIILPNAEVFNNSITNFSKKNKIRLDVPVGIGYDDNFKLAQKVIIEALEKEDIILQNEPIVVEIDEFGDSSVNLIVQAYVKERNYWAGKFKINEIIKNAIDQNGLTIPFPQRDVHIYKED